MTVDLITNAQLLLTTLLPGFAAAWLFYGVTSHPKPTQFERVVQALIFTFVIQAFLPVVRWLLEKAGTYRALGAWTHASEIITSLVLAIILGMLLAHFTNNDSIHQWLRRRGFTTRSSHPSEWYCVLSKTVTYLVLHLKDGRRLYGWPKEWPVNPSQGQFYVQEPSWIDESGVQTALPMLDGILIHASDVAWVEFMMPFEETENDQ